MLRLWTTTSYRICYFCSGHQFDVCHFNLSALFHFCRWPVQPDLSFFLPSSWFFFLAFWKRKKKRKTRKETTVFFRWRTFQVRIHFWILIDPTKFRIGKEREEEKQCNDFHVIVFSLRADNKKFKWSVLSS